MIRWDNSGSGRGVVSCDWFALSCKLGSPRGERELKAPAGCSVIRMSPTAVWADRFFIMDADGNKVATFLCTPRTPQVDATRALVEIANRWLYCDNFEFVVQNVLDCLPLAVTGLNRIDLCCDFEMTSSLWRTFMRLADGSAYVKSLREGVVWWKMISSGRCGSSLERIPHCVSWGGKESLVKWKIYWKWLELQEAKPEDKKPYISDLWRAMGFVERSVWRCEVSISSTNKLADSMGKRLGAMEWYQRRVQLWSDLYADKFVVRAAQGHKDKRNDDVLPFLEVVGSKSLWHALPRSERDESDPEVRIACRLWKELQQFDVQANDLLLWNVRNSLEQLFERASNLYAVCHRYGVTVDEVYAMLQP